MHLNNSKEAMIAGTPAGRHSASSSAGPKRFSTVSRGTFNSRCRTEKPEAILLRGNTPGAKGTPLLRRQPTPTKRTDGERKPRDPPTGQPIWPFTPRQQVVSRRAYPQSPSAARGMPGWVRTRRAEGWPLRTSTPDSWRLHQEMGRSRIRIRRGSDSTHEGKKIAALLCSALFWPQSRSRRGRVKR